MPDQSKYLRRKLPGGDRLCLLYQSIGRCEELKADILAAVFDRVFLRGGVPRTQSAFEATVAEHRADLVSRATGLAETLTDVLERHHAIRKRLKGSVPLAMMHALSDIQEQLDHLVYKGFVSATPEARLEELPRYLQALERRLDRLERDPDKDRSALNAVRPWWERYRERREQHERKGVSDPALQRFRWLLEEYRVSLFAQELGTREKVSDKRLAEAWRDVR